MKLRPYQEEAVAASLDWMRTSVSPFIVEAATGAGKSLLVSAVAHAIHDMTKKRVLCLAPSAELVTQNREKYLSLGEKASMFSASAGGKELRHPVVFGSPLTVKNNISRFLNGYSLVIIDEAHGITPTVKSIIEAMKGGNPLLRVMGLSATPYRLGDGWIFRMNPDGTVNGDDVAKDPYFTKCVYRIGARSLIEDGYLTPPVIGTTGAESYDTSGLSLNSRGQFDAGDIDRAYHGHGRLTSSIVGDVVSKAMDRKGVMFFSATVQHANEIVASLPPQLTAIITGETKKSERDRIIKAFKEQRIKYLVNVSVLTTGFDAPHVDLIAILRRTESVGLLQQIIGRGLRLSPGKTDCVILDYAGNIETHCPDGDLFAPVIKSYIGGGPSSGMSCTCPECGFENKFTARPDYLEMPHDEAGYVVDLDGTQVMGEYGPIPAHFGRRCFGMVRSLPRGEYERCNYRWTFKRCPNCDAENDIAARYCCQCKSEIIDPNEKLAMEFAAMKRDPTRLQTDAVISMECKPGISAKGNETLRVEFVTPYRQFTIWLRPQAEDYRGRAEWDVFVAATNDRTIIPNTVTYRKDAQSGFYKVIAYNREADVEPA